MTYDLSLYDLLTLIGASGFLGLILGFGLACYIHAGHSKHAFWEEE